MREHVLLLSPLFFQACIEDPCDLELRQAKCIGSHDMDWRFLPVAAAGVGIAIPIPDIAW